jgi:hypothetical protein
MAGVRRRYRHSRGIARNRGALPRAHPFVGGWRFERGGQRMDDRGSQACSPATVDNLTFASALVIGALTLVGLTPHELSAERVVHSLAVLPQEREPADGPRREVDCGRARPEAAAGAERRAGRPAARARPATPLSTAWRCRPGPDGVCCRRLRIDARARHATAVSGASGFGWPPKCGHRARGVALSSANGYHYSR